MTTSEVSLTNEIRMKSESTLELVTQAITDGAAVSSSPRCPECGSDDIAGASALDVMWRGVRLWCVACGYKWTPRKQANEKLTDRRDNPKD